MVLLVLVRNISYRIAFLLSHPCLHQGLQDNYMSFALSSLELLLNGHLFNYLLMEKEGT
jgi:hypothetical protein